MATSLRLGKSLMQLVPTLPSLSGICALQDTAACDVETNRRAVAKTHQRRVFLNPRLF